MSQANGRRIYLNSESFINPRLISHESKYHGNMITVDGVDHSRRHAGASEWLFVHRGCLSLVCHRLRLSPRQLWSSLFAPRNRVYCKDATGLIRCIEYYDMAGSARKFSADAFERITLGTVPCTELLDCMWLLARPTVLPIAPPVVVPQRFISHVPAVSTACLRVLTTPELLDIILDKLVHHHAEEEYASLLMADPAYVVLPCLVEATATLFSLIQVSRYFHSSILARRQDLFLRIAWESGWMLPASPGDWDLWPNGALAHPSDARRLCGQPGRDWRKYLLAFLRREDLHVRNRWRLHRMHVQFARGKVKMGQAWERPWKWSVGSLGVRTSLVPPERMPWEYAC
ncbi:hypothetical protein GLOTRDRAFT_128476 [Gloeophyllum trabeum ATCC 11539]|uniref:Uncharacterized protein n=1 Tax=Gloeophyllum trabeum (strain ATCC 11539 / FP-39264 / Madison 617) TaxID=670483 RepID=S7RTR5_GLOTA|nr:uncharacterized protein GLOTRDRAFT_128476 [Gloeophyllum trabeum ATCC 11539]EPQ56534.1 hypothetical protein GLOTRDRAFT_128476 [Gloeophyllum trabeum ATCC 11539]